MWRVLKAPLLIVSATLLAGSGPSWISKPVQQWTAEDAKQVLAGSPWVKQAPVVLLPPKSEDQRRESGSMGGNRGVGFDSLSVSVFTGGPSNSQKPSRRRPKVVESLEVRWESALPVRVAEKAAREDDPPAWGGPAYAIAVYDVPGLDIEDKALQSELTHAAVLKRAGKKDLRAVLVDLLPQENGLTTVLYLFPRTEVIGLDDKRVEFDARLGRLSLAQYFYPPEMQLQGKLEL